MRAAILTFAIHLAFVAASSAQTAKADPCGLLTQAEIKAAVGLEIGKMAINTKMDASAGTLCDFRIGDIGAGGIVLRTMGAGETARKVRAETRAHKIETADARGFGAGAFFSFGDYGITQLNAFKGSTHVIVQLMVMTMPREKAQAALRMLMTTALTRIK